MAQQNQQTMIKQLHPTLKACKCGYIGPRNLFYKHLDQAKLSLASHYPSQEAEFTRLHGESVLNVDDPRLHYAQTRPSP